MMLRQHVMCASFLALLASAAWGATPLEELQTYLEQPRELRAPLAQQEFAQEALTRSEAETGTELLWADLRAQLAESKRAEHTAMVIAHDNLRMKYFCTFHGQRPEQGAALYISLHGGGGAPPRVNDSQWENQKRLYSSKGKPVEGAYCAPRAPTDTWDLWHQSHMDHFFDQMILNMVLFEGVDRNRIYIMGYSAGGDGTYQIAPRMADRWAAASMSAGHPNDAQPLNLRNIGFSAHVGEHDSAYNRNGVTKQWKEALAGLKSADPTGYAHEVQIHRGYGHWMNLADAIGFDFMEKFTRNPWPKKVVWYQDDVTSSRLYWLARTDAATPYKKVVAEVEGQTITLSADAPMHLRLILSDALVNLDEPVTVQTAEGQILAQASITRTLAHIAQSLQQRPDPFLAGAGQVDVALPE